MIVIVEGPDGAGKSTVAENLDGFETIHFGPVTDPYYEYREALKYATGRDVVFDRIWPSEVVYGETLRDGSRLSECHLRLLRRRALSQGVVIIKCLPPEGAVVSNVRDSKQMDGVKSFVNKIYDGYVAYNTPLPVMTHDYTSRVVPDEDEVRGFATPTTDLRGKGCAREGTVMMVHDSPVIHDSFWFADHLTQTQYNERDLFWVHVDNFTDEHVEQIQPEAIKALGQKPLKRFMGSDVKHRFQAFNDPFREAYPDETPQIIKHCTIRV